MLEGSLQKMSDALKPNLSKSLLGGPEIYKVASNALTAGLPGKSTEKSCSVTLELPEASASLSLFNCCTIGHVCY